MSATSYLTQFSGHTSESILVKNDAELQTAIAQLDQGSGGTILLDGNGGPYSVRADGIGGSDSPILIKALDDSNPPTLHHVYITDSSHIAITGTIIDSTQDTDSWDNWDVRITGSDNIQIVGNVMTGDADGYLSSTTNATQAGNAGFIRDSSDIVVAGNDITNYFFGFQFMDSTDINYSGNYLTELQADGFSGSGIQNALIADNTMEAFFGSDQSVNHSDMIQIFGQGATLLNSNIELSGNFLNTDGGASYQGILIGGSGDEYFQNIKIYDNVVYSATPNGIRVEGVMGLDVQDNSVIWNPDNWSKMDAFAAELNYKPWIWVSDAPNALVSGNIASDVLVDGQSATDENLVLSYTNPNSAAYAPDHITNYAGDMIGLDDLSLKSDSPYYGLFGASLDNSAYANDVTDVAPEPLPASEPEEFAEPAVEEPATQVLAAFEPVVLSETVESDLTFEGIVEELPFEPVADGRSAVDAPQETETVLEAEELPQTAEPEDADEPQVAEAPATVETPPVVQAPQVAEAPDTRSDEDPVTPEAEELEALLFEETDILPISPEPIVTAAPVVDEGSEAEPQAVVAEVAETSEPVTSDAQEPAPVEAVADPEPVVQSVAPQLVAETAEPEPVLESGAEVAEPVVVEDPVEVSTPKSSFKSIKDWRIKKALEYQTANDAAAQQDAATTDDDAEAAATPKTGWNVFKEWKMQKSLLTQADDTSEQEDLSLKTQYTGGRAQIWLKSMKAEVTLSEVVNTFEPKDEPLEDEEENSGDLFFVA